MTRREYVPNIPPGTDRGLAAELRKIAAALATLQKQLDDIEARVTALEPP
jgi:hypothetical protein